MRNHRGDGMSRLDNRKSRTDRVLNWIIGIVSVLILVIGCFILITVFRTASSNSSASAGTSSKQQVAKTQSKKAAESKKGSEQVSNDASSTNSSADSSSSSVADADHQASYDKGTADWDAQVAAIASATDISTDQMTILWLGNGGSPNMSLARVAPKSSPNSVYVVHLTYKGGKWQADSVQKP